MRYVNSKFAESGDELAYRSYVSDGLYVLDNAFGRVFGAREDMIKRRFCDIISGEREQSQEEQELSAEEIKNRMISRINALGKEENAE